jgi:hypothetical protein
MQAECNEVGRVSNADDTENAAFFLQLVIVEGVGKEGSHGAALRIRGCMRHHVVAWGLTVTP